MGELVAYEHLDGAEALRLQFGFEADVFSHHKAADERDSSMNASFRQARQEALERVDGVLDRYNNWKLTQHVTLGQE